MGQDNFAIVWWPVDRPKPYAGNPRNITDAAVRKVAASLEEFGWRQPIVVDEAGVIIVGHTRLKAAKHLGLEKVPVHVAKDLTEKQARAYRIADNRTGEEAEWDMEALKREIEGIGAEPLDLGDIGFDKAELSRLLDEPDFDPVEEEEQGKLDENSGRLECPRCRYRWEAT